MCPLTLEVFVDPVLAADGHNYERAALQQALEVQSLSPMTRAPLQCQTALPNAPLRRQIGEWRLQQRFTIPPHLLDIDETDVLGAGATGQVSWTEISRRR